jgi:hypothetical protein
MYNLVKLWSDERLDLPDAEMATGLLDMFDGMRQSRVWTLPEGRNGGGAATECRILDGFDIPTALPSATLTLNRGSAIAKLIERGTLYFGLLAGEEGEASQVVDVSALPNDTYAVYVRFVFTDADSENRVFWDPSGTEYVGHVASRREMIWSYQAVSTSAPVPSGGDWIKVAELTVAAGVCSAVADYRHFYFEGDAVTGAGQWQAEWGTANDRNADRALYGVKDWHGFAQYCRTQFQTVMGLGYTWYGIPDPDLTDLAVEHDTDGQHLAVNAKTLTLDLRAGVGADSSWDLYTETVGTEEQFYIMADDPAMDPMARIDMAVAGSHARFSMFPRGEGNAYSNADYGELVALGTDPAGKRHGMRATLTDVAGSDYSYAFGELSGTPPMRLDQGVAAQAGLHLTEAGAGYYCPAATSRETHLWFTGSDDGSGLWVLLHSGAFGSAAPTLRIPDGNPAVNWYGYTHMFPKYCTITEFQINVNLEAGGAVVPTQSMQIDLYRHTWDSFGNYLGDFLLGTVNKTSYSNEWLTITPVANNDLGPYTLLTVKVRPCNGGSHTFTHVWGFKATLTHLSPDFFQDV